MDQKYFYDLIKEDIVELISSFIGPKYNLTNQEIANSIDISKFADFSCSIAFKISENQKNNQTPNQIALDLKAEFEQKLKFIKNIDVTNGFINFYLDKNIFSNNLVKYIVQSIENKSTFTEFLLFNIKHEKIIIESPSVNPNKPWHLGHLRNALLGDVISNIFQIYGYDVERQDYIDDLGLQMVESIWGYLHLNNKIDKKFDQWLGEEYVRVNKYIEENDIKQDLNALSALIEQDGTYESNLTKKIALQCVIAQYETAFSYDIYHNVLIWESDIVKSHLLEKSMKILKEGNFIDIPKEGKYANCTIINFDILPNIPDEIKAMEEKVKVLIRSNGMPTYLAKDIAFHMWKFGLIKNIFKYRKLMTQPNKKPLFTSESINSFYPDTELKDFGDCTKVINIIDSRQSYLQSLIKVAFNAIGKPVIANNLKHLSYGEVVLEATALSGRKGTWIGYTADLLLEQAKEKAHSLIKSKFELSQDDQKTISKTIALSAIKFEFLKLSPEKKLVFSWDDALNFNANSGPYAQYTYARASRILEKASIHTKDIIAKINFSYDMNEMEFDLIKVMSKIRSNILKSVIEYKPSILISYINELCVSFTRFYENIHILDTNANNNKNSNINNNEYNSRLAILLSFKYCIDLLFNIIGLYPLNKI